MTEKEKLTLNFPDDSFLEKIRTETPDLENLEFDISSFLEQSDDFCNPLNKMVLATRVQPSLSNKKNRLKITYYLMRYYYNENMERQSVSNTYWLDYFSEFFYRLYFSVIDLTFQALAVFYDVSSDYTDGNLKKETLGKLKEDKSKLYEYFVTIYEDERFKNAITIRNNLTHDTSPSESWPVIRKVDKKENKINYSFNHPVITIDVQENARYLISLLIEIWDNIHVYCRTTR